MPSATRVGVGRRAWRRVVEGARATTTATTTATTARATTARARGARATTTTTTRARAGEDRATAIGAWEAIRERARAAPDATATANAAGDGDATYGEMMALAARVAEELRALDVRKGDRVGVAATAGMEYCAAAYATWARGGGVGADRELALGGRRGARDAAFGDGGRADTAVGGRRGGFGDV